MTYPHFSTISNLCNTSSYFVFQRGGRFVHCAFCVSVNEAPGGVVARAGLVKELT